MADRVGREAGDLLAAEPDGARRARERPRDAVEGRGLPRAVRPDEPEDLAVPDPEGDRAQRREAAEALRQPANRENYRAANGEDAGSGRTGGGGATAFGKTSSKFPPMSLKTAGEPRAFLPPDPCARGEELTPHPRIPPPP